MRPTVDFAGLADLATSGSARLIICVCEDATVAAAGVEAVDLQWRLLRGTSPVHLSASGLLDRLETANLLEDAERDSLVLVADAWRGANEDLLRRWARLNSRRDAMRVRLEEANAALILFGTEQVLRLIGHSSAAVDLFGLAQIERGDDQSPAIEADETDLIDVNRRLLHEMEDRYRLRTEAFVETVLAREPAEIAPDDRRRWLAAASLLRKVVE